MRAIMARKRLGRKLRGCRQSALHLPRRPEKRLIFLCSGRIDEGIRWMYKPRKDAGWRLAIVAVLALLSVVAVLLGYPKSEPQVKDYEECAEEARANASLGIEYSKLITQCGESFAGRRNAGGGYAYFDFMQNRTFYIAGPNPNTDERKQIDSAYMEFLSAQRREMLSSDLAKQQADREQAAVEAAPQDVGPPLVLTPKVPLPVKRPVIERSKACEEGSLSCGWAKLAAAVSNAFASSAGTSR